MSEYKIDYCHNDSVTAKFVMEDDVIKVKWRHGDKHYIVPLAGLLELWERYDVVEVINCSYGEE